MKVLDLFSGLGGWAEAFRSRDHEVLTLDMDPKFGCDYTADILKWKVSELPDGWIGAEDLFVVASPPCECYSVASISTHWRGGKRAYKPKTVEAIMAIAIVQRTIQVIWELEPGRGWMIENPRGVLRRLNLLNPPDEPPPTIWNCHYGDTSAKPTDLFFDLPTFIPLPECHNRRVDRTTGEDLHAADCCCHDHEQARRGAKTGTQGKVGADRRAKIPFDLAMAVCLAAEANTGNETGPDPKVQSRSKPVERLRED